MLCDDIFNSIYGYCNGKSLIKMACINKLSNDKINNYVDSEKFANIFYLKNRIMITFFFMPILIENKINDEFKNYIYNDLAGVERWYHYVNKYKFIKNNYFKNGHDVFFEVFNGDILKKSKQFNDEIYDNISSNENLWNDFFYFIKKLNYDFKYFFVFIQHFKEKLNAKIISKILIELHSQKFRIKFMLISLKDYINKEYITLYVLRNLNIYNVDKFFEVIDWDTFSNNSLNFAIVNKYKNHINWNIYSRHIKNRFIHKFENYIVWSELSIFHMYNCFIEKNYDKPWNWYDILKQKVISINCLIKITNFLTESEINMLCEKQIINDSYIDLYHEKINWNIVCKYQKLNINIIKKYINFINWDIISEYQHLSYGMITTFDDYLNWTIILNIRKNIDKCLIEKYHDKISWNNILCLDNVPEKILILYKNIIDWDKFNYEIPLSNQTINKIYDKLNIEKIIQYNDVDIDTFIILKQFSDSNNYEINWKIYYMNNNYILDEKNILFFIEFLNWITIFEKQKLSSNIIDSYCDKFQKNEWIYMIKNDMLNIEELKKYSNKYIDFETIFNNAKLESDELLTMLELANTNEINMINIYDIICEKQKLTENFIDMHSNEIKWNKIWKYQGLSIDFIRKYIHKVVWKDICKYQKLDEQFIRDFYKKVSWMYIAIHQKLSDEFIIEFAHMMDKHRIIKYQKITYETCVTLYPDFD